MFTPRQRPMRERRNVNRRKYIMRKGLAVLCPALGRLVAAPHRKKKAFETQLQKAKWSFDTGMWKSRIGSPAWYPGEIVPDDAKQDAGKIELVYVIVDPLTGDIEHIHWYDSAKSAQIHFERHGFQLIEAEDE